MIKGGERLVQHQRWLGVRHVAVRLNCSERTVYRLLESGDLEGYRLHDKGWWKISEDSVARFVQRVRSKFALPQAVLIGGQRKC